MAGDLAANFKDSPAARKFGGGGFFWVKTGQKKPESGTRGWGEPKGSLLLLGGPRLILLNPRPRFSPTWRRTSPFPLKRGLGKGNVSRNDGQPGTRDNPELCPGGDLFLWLLLRMGYCQRFFSWVPRFSAILQWPFAKRTDSPVADSSQGVVSLLRSASQRAKKPPCPLPRLQKGDDTSSPCGWAQYGTTIVGVEPIKTG